MTEPHLMNTDSRIGTTLKQTYRVEKLVGRGGMGSVYRATHIRLGSPVAVKFLDAGRGGEPGNDPLAFGRFEREARLSRALAHENIVYIEDFDVGPDGTPYIVMEYLHGESLQRRIAQKAPLPLDETVNVVRQLARALGAAHAAQVVHRDLKPANVFLKRGPEGDEVVKLLDLGIAKVLDSSSLVTADGALLGTPAYMAPEQAKEGLGQLDGRADLFSLGCILYHMLAGTLPFPGTSYAQVLLKVMTEEPVPLCGARPDLPKGVEQVVNRALAKEPDQRFQTAAELVAALADAAEALVSHETGGASGPVRRSFASPPGAHGSATADIDTQQTTDHTVPASSVAGDTSRVTVDAATPPPDAGDTAGDDITVYRAPAGPTSTEESWPPDPTSPLGMSGETVSEGVSDADGPGSPGGESGSGLWETELRPSDAAPTLVVRHDETLIAGQDEVFGHPKRPARPPPRDRRTALPVVAAGALLLAVATAVILLVSRGNTDDPGVGAGQAPDVGGMIHPDGPARGAEPPDASLSDTADRWPVPDLRADRPTDTRPRPDVAADLRRTDDRPIERAAPKPRPDRSLPGPRRTRCARSTRVVAEDNGRPLRAKVKLDGRPRGTTPLRLCLPPGRHTLFVSRKGHRPAIVVIPKGTPMPRYRANLPSITPR